MPVDWSKYPSDWKAIVAQVATRSGGQCECRGQCGACRSGVRCLAVNRLPHPDTGSKVVLTTAHLTHATLRNLTAAECSDLARQAIEEDPEAKASKAKVLPGQEDLAGWLGGRVGEIRAAAGMPPEKPEDAAAQAGGAVDLDVAMAVVVEGCGPTGKDAAEGLRQPSELGPWGRWLRHKGGAASTVPALRLLADVGWLDVIKPRLRRERKQPAALTIAVHEHVIKMHSNIFKQEEHNGQRRLVYPDSVVKVERVDPLDLPAYEMNIIDNLIIRGLDRLGSIPAHRLFHWEVNEGHRRVLAGEPDARNLRVDGGWEALAGILGMSEKMGRDVHAIVAAQAHCVFQMSWGAYGNLLSYHVTPAHGRRRGQVSIVLGDALLPHYCHQISEKMGRGRSAFEAMRLVPMVDMPPFVGRPNDHGAQATMSMATVAEFRRQSRELAKHGGALVNFDVLAQQSGVSAGLVPRVLDRWTCDGDDGPAFLARVDKGRFTLSDAYRPQREFIVAQGNKELARSTDGKRSAAARQRKLPDRKRAGGSE